LFPVRISPLFRLTALWALLVFAAGWSEDALVLHPCPHHSAIAQAGAAHAGHGGAHHAAAQEPHDQDGAPAHKGPCSCVAACAGTAFALDAPRAELRVDAPLVHAGAIAFAPSGTALPGREHFVLPFPTAPPVLPA
ncbi:MAG: hypothetical protein ACJ8J0_14030, partial [Longimicrobiaceae bacterium]